jgi:glucosyl-3-phosphoglycerate synthase
MITVIIPALNEEKTIGNVIRYCRQHSHVSEIIVVDDNSEDNTVAEAEAAGAIILISRKRGKGISMQEGISMATNNVLVFLDADIDPYPQATIPLLTKPILNGEFDFVKATFSRNAGRVTEIMAKPLLTIFYPELLDFSQPLSGMIAGRKSFFEKIELFNDYGVDIGILIDMYLMKARIKEVSIGHIENKSKAWTALGKMSLEVARAITVKALQHRRDQVTNVTSETFHAIAGGIDSLIHPNKHKSTKLAVFDMDNTILKGRFIDRCAEEYGFTDKLEALRKEEKDPVNMTKRTAMLLRTVPLHNLLNIAADMHVVEDTADVVAELKKRGYAIGIISDSYDVIANYVKNRIDADFVMANQLEHYEGKVTGEVKIPSYFYRNGESKCTHSVCKTNALLTACEEHGVRMEDCIAIGDSENDRCMIEHAGTGVAFCTKDELLKLVADKNITESSFSDLLSYTS